MLQLFSYWPGKVDQYACGAKSNTGDVIKYTPDDITDAVIIDENLLIASC